MKQTSLILLALLLLMTGCSVRNNVMEPLEPPFSYVYHMRPRRTDSLSPVLAWKSSTPAEAFDLVVYAGFPVGESYTRGKEVYYREGLTNTQHRIEEALLRDQVYLWSVRARSGSSHGPWATYDYSAPAISARGQRLWWRFKTPRE